jgi:hypothetical protein
MAAPSVPHSLQTYVLTATGQTLTLREQAAQVAVQGQGALTATTFTSFQGGVTSATGTGTFAQFTGTAETPSETVGLGPGFEPGFLVVVDYVPASELPTDE